MAGSQYTSPSVADAYKGFNGGLNSTAGPLSVLDNESSDLQNIDFDKFGSILKRNGYSVLSTASVVGANASDGLHWYEFVASGTNTRYAINICNSKVYYMSALDGTWIDISGSVAPTATYHCDFENFNNIMFGTNGSSAPFQWGGSGNAIVVPAFTANSYTFLVSGVTVAPTVGATYTNNGITYTVTYNNLSGGAGALAGSVIATGSNIPEQTGTLTKTGGTGDATIDFTNATANANIQSARFVKAYNNYLFWANVVVAGTSFKTRIYWSNIKDSTSVAGDDWIEIGLNDGQEITGIKVLGQALVIYKERSIYQLYYTGDSDVPFILPGGGKMVSPVGCIAPFSIQDIDNGHIFLAPDGLYINNGSTTQKISYRISNTIESFNSAYLTSSVSCLYKIKNKYMISFHSSRATADRVIVWDWYNNAFSVYVGLAPSAMATFFVNGYIEQPYFADYNGYTYQTEQGNSDYPLGTETAIDSYYWTNWRTYQDLCDQKGIPQVYLYYRLDSTTIIFSYSYDFESKDQFSLNYSFATGSDVWGTMLWGSGIWSGSGGKTRRLDITGRGRVVRFKFANATKGEAFRIDGLGTLAHLETNI